MRISTALKKYKKLLIILAIVVVLAMTSIVAICYYTISPYRQFIRTQDNAEHTKVGLVLGAGIGKNGKPYDELKARLDIAAEALNRGTVDILILSGDNRFVNYNEPLSMKEYLIEAHQVPAEKLVLDYAGRSTYESCERATKVFKVNQLIIFSANSHLPRALYLCRQFGIDATGIASGTEANNSTRRELLARVKALYNIHVSGEPTVLGDPIPLN